MAPIARLLPALSLALLSACQPATDTGPETAASASTEDASTYIARGNEPGWILKMDGKVLDYQGNYGETKITVPQPEGRPSLNGMRYVTERLVVDITYASCADVMSGERFTDTVSIRADGKEYKGCGGRKLPPESLNNTSWTIIMMDQLPTLESVKTEVHFADGKISGTAGCNRFTGTYTHQSNTITFGAIASTRMMCPEKQMAQEAKFLALLNGKVTKRYSVEGNLILANESGQRATLKPVI
jgi:heat shock protein HslJ